MPFGILQWQVDAEVAEVVAGHSAAVQEVGLGVNKAIQFAIPVHIEETGNGVAQVGRYALHNIGVTIGTPASNLEALGIATEEYCGAGRLVGKAFLDCDRIGRNADNRVHAIIFLGTKNGEDIPL